jgi:hypothetical protein
MQMYQAFVMAQTHEITPIHARVSHAKQNPASVNHAKTTPAGFPPVRMQIAY